MTIHIQRIYEPRARDGGVRVLVDRLWPRGISKADADFDHWLKDIAPSTALRKWFGHNPARWSAFKKRYFDELQANPEVVAGIRRIARNSKVTLLYSARDLEHNQAVALRDYLLKTKGGTQAGSSSARPAPKRRRASNT